MAKPKIEAEIFDKVLDEFAFYSEKDLLKCGGTVCNLNGDQYCHEALADQCHPCSEQCGPTRESSPSPFCLEKCLWYIKKGELKNWYHQYEEPGYDIPTVVLTTSPTHSDHSSQTKALVTAVVVQNIIVCLLVGIILFYCNRNKKLQAELRKVPTNRVELQDIGESHECNDAAGVDQHDQSATTQLVAESQRTSGYTTSSPTPDPYQPGGRPLSEYLQRTPINSTDSRPDQSSMPVSSRDLSRALRCLPQQCQTPAMDDHPPGMATFTSMNLSLVSNGNGATMSERRPESSTTRLSIHQPESAPMYSPDGHAPRYPHYLAPETAAHTN